MPTPQLDLVLLLQACSEQLNAEVLTSVRADVGPDIRFHDGYLFQHLVEGPIGVTALGRRLGVSQQAASKQVADLCGRGLARIVDDPSDRRTRLVELTERGRAAIEAGRRARAEVTAHAEEILGADATRRLRAALARLGEETGAIDQLLGRRLRPDHEGAPTEGSGPTRRP